jgi:hypothetical protein
VTFHEFTNYACAAIIGYSTAAIVAYVVRGGR